MLLAVDTSTAQVGLALCDGGQLAAESIWYSHQHHTVELAPALAELFKRTGLTINDVEALGIAIGPGSFTALRVGLAFVKGLALARKLPVVGIPTLDVLAAGQSPAKMPLGAVLQAGRGRIALAWYRALSTEPQRANGGDASGRGWQAQGAAQVTTVDALADSIDKPTLIAGELTPAERQRLARKKVNVVLAPPSTCVRRPSLLAELARARLQAGQTDEPASLAPIYLHLGESILA